MARRVGSANCGTTVAYQQWSAGSQLTWLRWAGDHFWWPTSALQTSFWTTTATGSKCSPRMNNWTSWTSWTSWTPWALRIPLMPMDLGLTWLDHRDPPIRRCRRPVCFRAAASSRGAKCSASGTSWLNTAITSTSPATSFASFASLGCWNEIWMIWIYDVGTRWYKTLQNSISKDKDILSRMEILLTIESFWAS